MNAPAESPPAKSVVFEWFELCTALLLGFGALGASLAGYQGGMWNGKSSESFAKASSMITRAAGDEHRAVLVSMHDTEVDMEAKKLIAEAMFASDARTKQGELEMASSLYVRHLSNDAYTDLGLPPEPRAAKAKNTPIPVEDLLKAKDRDLDEAYMQRVFAKVEQDHKIADEEFTTGSHASSQGDRFALAEVLFAVSLFVVGTGLVFKTQLRWVFAGIGGSLLLCAYVYLSRLEWV